MYIDIFCHRIIRIVNIVSVISLHCTYHTQAVIHIFSLQQITYIINIKYLRGFIQRCWWRVISFRRNLSRCCDRTGHMRHFYLLLIFFIRGACFIGLRRANIWYLGRSNISFCLLLLTNELRTLSHGANFFQKLKIQQNNIKYSMSLYFQLRRLYFKWLWINFQMFIVPDWIRMNLESKNKNVNFKN